MKWNTVALYALLSVLLSLPLSAGEQGESLCRDANANREWAKLLAANPNDLMLTRLFAFRQSLCWMIDQGLLTVDRATELFEKERSDAIDERQRENAQRQGAPVL